MDEPTNHLDMEMRHALTVAIQTFKGAILLISHDRHLLNSSVDTFYLIDNGALEIFDGDLDDYKNYILDIKSSDNKQSKKKKSAKDGPKEDNSEKIKTLNSSISKLDKRLFRLNTKLTEANNKLADPELYSDDSSEDLQDLIRNQLELTNEVEAAEKEWMDKAAELDILK
jgi:ATP-binding cassette subfamily F protein 3